MDATGELGWFRSEVARSLLHPFDFARSLAREHFGLAGVLVAIASGVALSFGTDVIVLASKGLAAYGFVAPMITNALFLGVRLAIAAAIVAWLASLALRALKRRGTLDQVYTGLTFALAPLLLIPVPVLLLLVAPDLITNTVFAVVVAACLLALIGRVLVGIGLNLRGILPPALAAVAFVIVMASGWLVLSDQVSRLRFVTYAVQPGLVPRLQAPAATGERFEQIGFELTLPPGWKNVTSGNAGEAARFESSRATLTVARASSLALSTADGYATSIGERERQGLDGQWRERDVVRVNGLLVVDDRYGGTYEGRPIVVRQFTTVAGRQGLALVYRSVDPPDRDAALAEAASIAATWHVAGSE